MAYTINRRLGELIDSTGQLNDGKIPNDYINGDHIADNTITSSMLHTTFSVPAASLTGIDTDDVSEGVTNVYYTDARARGAISVSGSLSYDSGTGVVSYTTPTTIASLSNHTTDTLTEGSTNLYYTDARVGSYLTANSYATQSYVSTAVSNLVDSAPATLDTLNELAAALGDDPNFATTITNSIATKWTQDNTKISNWDTAYSWGDHASAGYLTNNIYLLRDDNRTISPSEYDSGRLRFGFTSWNNNSTSPYADFLHMRSYTDSSGGADNLLMLKKSGIGLRLWQQTYGSSTAYSSYVDVWHSGNDGSGSGLDADLLAGVHNSRYMRNDISVTGTTGSQFYVGVGQSSNIHISIKHGTFSGDYGAIRFYDGNVNHQTIHAFSTTWQGGGLTSSSTGAINLTGYNGVTFGPWNVPTGYVDNSGNAGFRGNVTAYAYSDIRLKHDVRPIFDDPLSKLAQLRGVRFDWDEEYVKSQHGDEDERWCPKHDVGMIAQEVQEVLPEITVEQDSGYLAIRYEKMIPLLVESIKALKAEVDDLKAQLKEK